MKLFKVVCIATGKTVARGFPSKGIAKQVRNDYNGEKFTHKISPDVDHWKSKQH